MFFGWYVVHKYVTFSYRALAKTVYLPIVAVTFLSILPPYVTTNLLDCGWERFIVTLVATEFVILLSVFYIGLNKVEREKVTSYIVKFKSKL